MTFWQKKPTAKEAALEAKKETKREVRVSYTISFFFTITYIQITESSKINIMIYQNIIYKNVKIERVGKGKLKEK